MAATDKNQTLDSNKSNLNIFEEVFNRRPSLRCSSRGWRGVRALRCFLGHCCVSSGCPCLYRAPAYAHHHRQHRLSIHHRQSRRPLSTDSLYVSKVVVGAKRPPLWLLICITQTHSLIRASFLPCQGVNGPSHYLSLCFLSA